MRKILFLTAVAFCFASEAEARFIFNRNKDDTPRTETVKVSRPVSNIKEVTTDKKGPEKRSFLSKGSSEEKIDENKVVSPKIFSKEDRMMTAVTGPGGSPALLKSTKENIVKLGSKSSDVNQKPLSNSLEDLKARRAKNSENYQEKTGLTLEEADAFYSNSLKGSSQKKIKLVSDPLDRD